jgi:hypothetical protein
MKTIIDSGLIQWNPPQNLVDHMGQCLSPDMVFFTPLPPEIGQIVSASSSMLIGKKVLQRRKGYKRRAFVLIFGFAQLVCSCLVLANLSGLGVLAAIVIFSIGPIIAGKIGYFAHSCTFVGSDGFSSIEWDGRKQACKPAETFLFERAASFSSILKDFYLLFYISTTYMLMWKDANDKKIWFGATQFRKRKGLPPLDNMEYSGSLYCFYQAAENVWKSREDDLKN